MKYLILIIGLLFSCHSKLKVESFDPFALLESPPLSAPSVQANAPQPFVLLSGDLVEVRVLSSESEPVSLIVDPSGDLHLPLVGGVRVAGLTLSEAEASISSSLSRFEKFAAVSLRMIDAQGHTATVSGAVVSVGRFQLRNETRVSDLLASAGGPQHSTLEASVVQHSDLASARLIRGGVALSVDVSLAYQGDPAHNIRVHPFDVLYVPFAQPSMVSVLGNVASPKNLPFYEGLRLSGALSASGGLSFGAKEVRVIRGPLSAPKIYRTTLASVASGESPDVSLKPGDIVFVSEHWAASVSEVIQRVIPALALLTGVVAFTQ